MTDIKKVPNHNKPNAMLIALVIVGAISAAITLQSGGINWLTHPMNDIDRAKADNAQAYDDCMRNHSGELRVAIQAGGNTSKITVEKACQLLANMYAPTTR